MHVWKATTLTVTDGAYYHLSEKSGQISLSKKIKKEIISLINPLVVFNSKLQGRTILHRTHKINTLGTEGIKTLIKLL